MGKAMIELLLVKSVWTLHSAVSQLFEPVPDHSVLLAVLCIAVTILFATFWYIALDKRAKADAEFRTNYVLWQIAVLRDMWRDNETGRDRIHLHKQSCRR